MFKISGARFTRPAIWLRFTSGVFAPRSGEEGSAMVETALVMPVVLVFMTAMFSLSTVLYQKLELVEAVGSGARFLAVDRGDNDPCAATANVIYAAAPNLSKSKMSLSFVLNGVSYSGATCNGTTGMVSGATAQLKATYPCTMTAFRMSFGTCTLAATTSEAIQ